MQYTTRQREITAPEDRYSWKKNIVDPLY